MRMPENFDAEVYAVVADIPAGRVVSYKQIARLVGMPDGWAARSPKPRRVCPATGSSTAQAAPSPDGRGSGSCSKPKAYASRPTAAPTSPAAGGRRSGSVAIRPPRNPQTPGPKPCRFNAAPNQSHAGQKPPSQKPSRSKTTPDKKPHRCSAPAAGFGNISQSQRRPARAALRSPLRKTHN